MPDNRETTPILIAGPTAGGKSALALDIAARLGGEIVNADAMQVYEELRIVTARPSPEDEARAPHHLYGVLKGGEPCSAGRWAAMAAETISAIRARSAAPIIVGGTGLYFAALTEGLSPIPEIAPAFREAARLRHAELGPDAFRAEVVAADPAMARLPAGDTQRLLRAHEVCAATGKPLSHFQALPRRPLLSGDWRAIVFAPDREALYARCDARAAMIMGEAGLEEVRRLLTRGYPPAAPVMKALGVPEAAQFLAGEATFDDALALLQRNTRRFAKRQLTWFRNQNADWPSVADAQAALAAFT